MKTDNFHLTGIAMPSRYPIINVDIIGPKRQY
jgi:hypothetical protein